MVLCFVDNFPVFPPALFGDPTLVFSYLSNVLFECPIEYLSVNVSKSGFMIFLLNKTSDFSSSTCPFSKWQQFPSCSDPKPFSTLHFFIPFICNQSLKPVNFLTSKCRCELWNKIPTLKLEVRTRNTNVEPLDIGWINHERGQDLLGTEYTWGREGRRLLILPSDLPTFKEQAEKE